MSLYSSIKKFEAYKGEDDQTYPLIVDPFISIPNSSIRYGRITIIVAVIISLIGMFLLASHSAKKEAQYTSLKGAANLKEDIMEPKEMKPNYQISQATNASVNVYLEISSDDYKFYTPPEIIIDGILYPYDGRGDCCDLDVTENGSFIGVLRDEGGYEKIEISLDKILSSMSRAPFCEALVIDKKIRRQCMKRSKEKSDGQVRCHHHKNTTAFNKYEDECRERSV